MADRTINKTKTMGSPTMLGGAIDTTLATGLSLINPILGAGYNLLSGGFKAAQDAIQRKKAREMSGEISTLVDTSDINIYGGRYRGEGSDFDTTQVVTSYEDVSNNAGIAKSVAGVAGNLLNMGMKDNGFSDAASELDNTSNAIKDFFSKKDNVVGGVSLSPDKMLPSNHLVEKVVTTPNILDGTQSVELGEGEAFNSDIFNRNAINNSQYALNGIPPVPNQSFNILNRPNSIFSDYTAPAAPAAPVASENTTAGQVGQELVNGEGEVIKSSDEIAKKLREMEFKNNGGGTSFENGSVLLDGIVNKPGSIFDPFSANSMYNF